MISELIVHIGPPKTSTTAIQMAFFSSRNFLAEQNFWYQFDELQIANHQMYKYLSEITEDLSIKLSAEEMRDNPAFPKLAAGRRQMISCEDFSMLQLQSKVDCILRWAEPKSLQLIFAYREPTRWLWSLFQQSLRDSLADGGDWAKFLDQSLENSELLTSNILKPWLNLELHPQIRMFNQISDPVVNTPMNIAKVLKVDLLPSAIEDCFTRMYNESLELGECMLMPLFNQEVVNDLKFRQQNWGEIPKKFIQNVFLYQSSTAKVLFELGRNLENQLLSRSETLLDESSLAKLQQFGKIWWDDFEQTVGALEITDQFGNGVDSGERPTAFTGFDVPIGKGFPRMDYKSKIELPSEFFSLARLYASNIGLLWRSLTETKSVEWLMPSE